MAPMSGAIIISRADAIARGLKFYFTGKPCRRGHVAQRKLMGGMCGVCVECRKINTAAWRETNRERHNSWGERNPKARKTAQDRYLERHPERRKKSALDWMARNRESQRVYQRDLKKRLRETDEDWRLRQNLRGRIRKALIRVSAAKSNKTLELIGCTVAELKAHLERQFTPGMTWASYGHGPGRWNVDHRAPCSSFDLTDPAQQRACFHFSNLQPMWHVDNVAKGDRITCQDNAQAA